MNVNFHFGEMKEFWRFVAQQCELLNTHERYASKRLFLFTLSLILGNRFKDHLTSLMRKLRLRERLKFSETVRAEMQAKTKTTLLTTALPYAYNTLSVSFDFNPTGSCYTVLRKREPLRLCNREILAAKLFKYLNSFNTFLQKKRGGLKQECI